MEKSRNRSQSRSRSRRNSDGPNDYYKRDSLPLRSLCGLSLGPCT